MESTQRTRRAQLLTSVSLVVVVVTVGCGTNDRPGESPDSVALRARNDSAYSDTALHRELLQRVDRDQAVREVFAEGLRTTGNVSESTAREMMAVDSANIRWLKPIIAARGLPSKAQIGRDGLNALFLLVQHADQDLEFQESVLPMLQRAFDRGEVQGQELAMLSDRVAKARKRPQIYGTQSSIIDGRPIIDPIADSLSVDARRAKMGLPPLAQYKAMLDSAYAQRPKGESPQ